MWGQWQAGESWVVVALAVRASVTLTDGERSQRQRGFYAWRPGWQTSQGLREAVASSSQQIHFVGT